MFWLPRIFAAHGHLCPGPALVSQPHAGFGWRETGRQYSPGTFASRIACALAHSGSAGPPGGLVGTLIARTLRATFNSVGAHVVAAAVFLTALFLTTRFSFASTHALVSKPVNKLDLLGRLKARIASWREGREQERLRQRLASIKTGGRQPVSQPNATTKDVKETRAAAADNAKEVPPSEQDKTAPEPGIVLVRPEAISAAAQNRKAAEPKIGRGATGFRLPSVGLLRMAERSERIEESELKECARAIEQKCR